MKQVGKVLWGQVAAEEEVAPQTLVHKLQPIVNKFWYLDFTDVIDQFDSRISRTFFIVDEALIKCFHLDVLTQPPDLA